MDALDLFYKHTENIDLAAAQIVGMIPIVNLLAFMPMAIAQEQRYHNFSKKFNAVALVYESQGCDVYSVGNRLIDSEKLTARLKNEVDQINKEFKLVVFTSNTCESDFGRKTQNGESLC